MFFDDSVEFIDSKIRFHDRQRFEMKIDVELEKYGRNRYKTETYFFVPSALNINARTYDKNAFFANIQNYMRFKTPSMSLEKMCDPSAENSPLLRVRNGLSWFLSGGAAEPSASNVCNEIKLLGCMSKDYLRDYVKELLFDLKEPGDAIDAAAEKLLKEIVLFNAGIDSLRLEIFSPAVPEKVKTAFAYFEEYYGIMLEEYLVELLPAIEKPELADRLKKILAGRLELRKKSGYAHLKKNDKNETITFRKGMLKKFISSVLYLRTEIKEWEGPRQVLFGIAAGVAMFFAITVTIYAQRKYQFDSMPFILLIVLSYIFKDRIKDWLKLWFSKSMTKWISDRKMNVYDPMTNKKIGVLKDAFIFISKNSVPPDIYRMRNIDDITSISGDGKPENIFKYEKVVDVFTTKITKFHERRKDIHDIMRFNLYNYTFNADDSFIAANYLDYESGEICVKKCARVYHVNVIVKYIYNNPRQIVNYDRIRIVLNKEGVVRVENVEIY